MKRPVKIVLISSIGSVVLLAAIAAIAGPVIYRDLVVGEALPAPTVSPASSASSAGTDMASALSSTWVVTDDSYAGYRVDEVLNGTDVTVVGRTEDVSGTLSVDPETLTLEAATIEVDVASISSDSARRDGYFRDTTMRVSEYPTATFRLTEPVIAPSLPENGQPQTVRATGELTLAGQTRPVTIELQAVLQGATSQVAGSVPITFADFGITAPSLGFVSVDPTGVIEFSLQLRPA